MLVATSLVMLMTPGLAFFYGGLRVTAAEESKLDEALHGETAYQDD
jgi:ammonia channel protein AmtB